jgi:hypothetical protein
MSIDPTRTTAQQPLDMADRRDDPPNVRRLAGTPTRRKLNVGAPQIEHRLGRKSKADAPADRNPTGIMRQ